MQEVLDKALHLVTKFQENTRSATNELKRLKKLFEKGDLTKLSTQLENNRLKNALEVLNLQDVYSELKRAIEQYTTFLRLEFDKKFLSTCQELHLGDVKGNSMGEFRIRGILHVRIDFRKKIAELKTFARFKKIKYIDPIKVARESKSEITRLFERPFEPQSFLTKLFKAYEKIQTTGISKNVLLKDIHRVMWIEKQKDNFFETSDPTKMTLYPLDEFSTDLARLIESRIQTTNDGYTCKISLGSGGINIYRSDGSFNSYKFLEFVRGGENA